MNDPEALALAASAVSDPSARVRFAALGILIEYGDESAVESWIRLLADDDKLVRETASYAIRQKGEEAAPMLIQALAAPSVTLRNEVLAILDELEARPVELSQFIQKEVEKAYRNLAYIQSLSREQDGITLGLLRDHLQEKNGEHLETVLRVLAVMEFGESIDVIRRALQTQDKRDIDNAIEALESALHSGLKNIIIPILEDSPVSEKLAVGRKRFGIELTGAEPVEDTLDMLIQEDDPITQTLSFYALDERSADAETFAERIQEGLQSSHPIVREAARILSESVTGEDSSDELSDLDKLIALRNIPIFEELRVRELMAIATITEEQLFSPGEAVVREGDQGDIMYLVLKGELAVKKVLDQREGEVLLARIGENDFFGEMALFDRQPRSASVYCETEAQCLAIEEQSFTRIMVDYPAIPISICKVFSQRTRDLHEKLENAKREPGE